MIETLTCASFHDSPCLLVHGRSCSRVPGIAGRASQSLASSASVLLPRLPLLPWRRGCSYQLLVGESLARYGSDNFLEAGTIIGLMSIVPELFLGEITEQVEGFNIHIGSANGPLQETPEVLNTVGMDVAPNVSLGVVNDLVDVDVAQITIRWQGIGEYFTPSHDVLSDDGGKALALSVGDNLSPHTTGLVLVMPLQHSHNGGLAVGPSASYLLFPFALVHEAGLTADEGFVHFHLTGEGAISIICHCGADTMEHEPSCLLGNIKVPGHFVGTDAVLGIGNEPDRSEPLIKSHRAVLKDGAHLDRELPLGVLALAFPDAARGDEPNIVASASWARYPIGPAQANHEVQADIRVREVSDCFYQSLWFAVHVNFPFQQIQFTTSQLLCQVYCCQS